ncbi:MAG: phage antirepressor N-terminal domain-containing protein [bacterium]
MNERQIIKFHGDELIVFMHDDQPYVALKPICDALKVDWEGQRQRIFRSQIYASVAFITKATGADGKSYEMVCLPFHLFSGWLMGIETSRIKDDLIRAKVLLYQMECHEVLFKHFFGSKDELEQRLKEHDAHWHKTLESNVKIRCSDILKLYIEKIFKDPQKFYLAQWVWRMRTFFTTKDIASFEKCSTSKISKLYRNYDHYLDATRYDRFYDSHHKYDDLDYYDIRDLYLKYSKLESEAQFATYFASKGKRGCPYNLSEEIRFLARITDKRNFSAGNGVSDTSPRGTDLKTLHHNTGGTSWKM